MLPTKFRFIWSSGCRGEDFSKSTNQKRELHVAFMFVNESGQNEHSSQRTFHIIMFPTMFWFIWQSGFRGEDFSTQPIRNRNGLQRPCLLTDRNEKSNLDRTPYIYATYQVSVQLVMRFQRRIFVQKSAYQKHVLPVVAMFVNGSGQKEQFLWSTLQRFFCQSFSSLRFSQFSGC